MTKKITLIVITLILVASVINIAVGQELSFGEIMNYAKEEGIPSTVGMTLAAPKKPEAVATSNSATSQSNKPELKNSNIVICE